jgi:peroxin-1
VLLPVSLTPTPKSHKALLLTADTEVAVAPKTRPKQHGAQAKATSAKKEAKKINEPSSTSTRAAEKDHPTIRILRVLPPRLAKRFKEDSAAQAYGGRSFVYVSPCTFAELTGCSLGSLAVEATRAPQVFYCADGIVLQPPSDPTAAHSAPSITPTTKVLNPSDLQDKSNSSTDEQSTPAEALLLGWAEGVPEKHVVLSNAASLKDAQDWDLIRCALAWLGTKRVMRHTHH